MDRAKRRGIRHKATQLWSRLWARREQSCDGSSIAIQDAATIEAFVADPENTFLVSFLRTGSHWLRMLMELYFERPSLVRVFYFPECTDYLTLHTHDLNLDVERSRVIYLFRDPVDTVFSQIMYDRHDWRDRDRAAYWADRYGQHLDKWLLQERFSQQKTVVAYNGLQQNLDAEFAKIVHHFGESLDSSRLARVAAQVSKQEVKRKTGHDPQVVQVQADYALERQRFREELGDWVWQSVTRERPYLLDLLTTKLAPVSDR